jgi:hypothetical protein
MATDRIIMPKINNKFDELNSSLKILEAIVIKKQLIVRI